MINSNLLPLAKEGWKYIASSVVFILVFAALDLDILAFLTTLALVGLLFTFRNPERSLVSFSQSSVLAVSDGVVKSIEELTDDEYAYKITVEGDFFDVGILRTPFNASLVEVELTKGTRVSKISKLFNDLNENLELVFENEIGNRVKIIHKIKQSFIPLFLDAITLQKLLQTSRYGMMVNGETTIYLPRNFRLNVNVGNELKAAVSLLGYFS